MVALPRVSILGFLWARRDLHSTAEAAEIRGMAVAVAAAVGSEVKRRG